MLAERDPVALPWPLAPTAAHDLLTAPLDAEEWLASCSSWPLHYCTSRFRCLGRLRRRSKHNANRIRARDRGLDAQDASLESRSLTAVGAIWGGWRHDRNLCERCLRRCSRFDTLSCQPLAGGFLFQLGAFGFLVQLLAFGFLIQLGSEGRKTGGSARQDDDDLSERSPQFPKFTVTPSRAPPSSRAGASERPLPLSVSKIRHCISCMSFIPCMNTLATPAMFESTAPPLEVSSCSTRRLGVASCPRHRIFEAIASNCERGNGQSAGASWP